ncbi:MAG: hypothetical protein ACE5JI_23055 [Acidobacteriota bacterium]
MSASEGERKALCPGCGQVVELSPSAQEGDRVSCAVCAGSAYRLLREEDRWTLASIPAASCPVCDEVVELGFDVRPGETVEHCGRALRLSFEYGAWALEGEAAS